MPIELWLQLKSIGKLTLNNKQLDGSGDAFWLFGLEYCIETSAP